MFVKENPDIKKSLWGIYQKRNIRNISEKKCPCGLFGQYRPRQRKGNVCVDEKARVGYESGKKTFKWINRPKWGTVEARKCLSERTSLYPTRQKYMYVSTCMGNFTGD